MRPAATVTDLWTRTRYQPDYASLARSRVHMARASTGLSAEDFAAKLSPLVGWKVEAGHVRSWESDVIPPGDVLVAATAMSPSTSSRLGVRSHKFIAAHIGPTLAARISTGHGGMQLSPIPPNMICHKVQVEHHSGQCDLYVWPFGSVIFHLIEDLDLPDIASLALWRYRSYEENLAWASERLRYMTGDQGAEASYVLSAYWVHNPIWSGRILHSALRIICAPRVLLDREIRDAEACQCNAARAERELLAEGFEHGEMRPFGLRGVSAGFASWSGVVYHAFDPKRALAEEELVSLELALQAVWMYCAYINGEVEQGNEPVIGDGYGCCFLRAARSKLMNPRPQETGQHRSMRDAVVETSGLPAHLALAMDALKEAVGK